MSRILPLIFATVICVTASPNETDYGPGYGDEWLLYEGEDGVHVMNFSTIPTDTRDLRYGDAHFYLYTRRNTEPEELEVPIHDGQNITSEYFNSSNKLTVVTHGWMTTVERWLIGFKNQLLKHNDYNVIIIDWSELSMNPIYPWAAFSTKYVGKKTARLLHSLSRSYNIDSSSIHLMGHSLGAQVMGHASNFLNYTVKRITGLDPARPLFELPMMPEHCRLDKTDAEFVDIIHTHQLYGYKTSQGDADFFPNGGTSPQPGCTEKSPYLESCSHSRAYLYYQESINREILFKAYPCEDWEKFQNGFCTANFTYMGASAKPGDKGNYYLHTKAEQPYAIGG